MNVTSKALLSFLVTKGRFISLTSTNSHSPIITLWINSPKVCRDNKVMGIPRNPVNITSHIPAFVRGMTSPYPERTNKLFTLVKFALTFKNVLKNV